MAKKPMSINAIRKHNEALRSAEYAAQREKDAVALRAKIDKIDARLLSPAGEMALVQRIKDAEPAVVEWSLADVRQLHYQDEKGVTIQGYQPHGRRALILWLEAE